MASWHDLFLEFWRSDIHGWGPEEYGAEHSLAMQSFRHGYEAAKHIIKQLENRLAAAQLAGDALESQLFELAENERSSRAEVERLRVLLDNRAGKLLKKDKFFLVVANDEPYFSHVYDLIRKHERHHGRWSEDDERMYCEQIAKWDWPNESEVDDG